jgi:predicted metalloprotease with PDZ domain
LVASAAPPADTNPAPSIPSQTKSTIDKSGKDAQSAPAARKDAPSANASTSGSSSTSGSATSAAQPTQSSTAPSASAQTGANIQGGVNAQGSLKTQAAPNAAGANVQSGTNIQGQTGSAIQSTAPAANANSQPQTAVQGQTNVQGQANLQGQTNLQGATNLNVQGSTAQANIARISSAIGLGFAQTANALTLSTVAPNSVFSSVGFLPGDTIVSFAGQNFVSPAAFTQYLTTVPIGQQIPIVVMRNGAQQTLYWTPTPAFAQMISARPNMVAVQLPVMPLNNLGIRLDPNVPNAAVVAQVADGSPADQAGVMQGDQIVALNDQEIHSPNEFAATLAQLPAGAPLNLSLSRNVQQNVQVAPSTPVPMTAARPVAPVAPNPVYQPTVRRGLFRRF